MSGDEPEGPQDDNSEGRTQTSDSERTCAVTRAVLPPDGLIRFVAAPDGLVVPDLEQKLPGRGVWLTCDRKIVDKAIKSNAFSRGLKATARVPDGLADLIDGQLVRRATQTLALANKAGLVTSGFQKVDTALARGTISVLVSAADAAIDGRGKLERKFAAVRRDKGQKAPVVSILTIAEISLAIGRPSVVHAGLNSGGLTNRFLREAERLRRYRAAPDASGQHGAETISEANVRLNG